MPENRRAYNIQQFANFRVAHIQEVGQENNIAFPFGQSVKGFGKQFIFDEYTVGNASVLYKVLPP